MSDFSSLSQAFATLADCSIRREDVNARRIKGSVILIHLDIEGTTW